jgi:hypothetical protein
MAVIQVFMEIRQAKKGDLMLNYDGIEEEIKSIEYINDVSDVYNLEVAGNHNYFAENVLVHNKCGDYRGSDAEARAAIRRNEEAWEATQKSMGVLDKQAQDIIKQAERQSATAKEIFAGQTKARNRESRQQYEKASDQAGRAGLVTGEATRNVQVVGDIARDAAEQAQTVFTSEQIGLEEQVGKSLFEIESAKSTLYANYVSNMEGDYSNTPEYESSYGGGYTMGDQYAGGTGGEFSSWRGSGSVHPTTGALSRGIAGATIGTATFGPVAGTVIGGVIGIGAGLTNDFGTGGCFISTTKVDNKNISEVQTGDMVSSYNKDKKIIEKSEVIETFKHKDNSGYLIINGRIKATPNHPFYIKRYV